MATLWIGGMPGTAKFADLVRDPRFSLHTATVDTHVGDGDAKVGGTGAAAVEVGGGHMDVTVRSEGAPEHVVRKH